MGFKEDREERKQELFLIAKNTVDFDVFVTVYKDLLDNHHLDFRDEITMNEYEDVLLYIDRLQFVDQNHAIPRAKAMKNFEENSIPFIRNKKLQELLDC
jgi:hypothetical protein